MGWTSKNYFVMAGIAFVITVILGFDNPTGPSPAGSLMTLIFLIGGIIKLNKESKKKKKKE